MAHEIYYAPAITPEELYKQDTVKRQNERDDFRVMIRNTEAPPLRVQHLYDGRKTTTHVNYIEKEKQ